jgi:hypothetical protein
MLCGGGWDATGVAPSREDCATVVVGPRYPVQLGSGWCAACFALRLEVGLHNRLGARVHYGYGSSRGSRTRRSPIGLCNRLGFGLNTLDRVKLGF